jgi:hypothetical protein
MRRARLLPLLISALAARPAASQWQFSADLGASQLRRPDIPRSGAVTFGANAGLAGDRGFFRSSVLAVGANSQQSTVQGLLAGSITESTDRLVRGEIGGFVSGFGESGYSLTVSGEIMPRVQIGTAARGGALGIGFGGTQHAGASASVVHPSADAWWSFASEQFASSLSFVKSSGAFLGNVSPGEMPSFYDLTGAWRHDRGGIVLGASGGYRYGARSVTEGGWGSAEAALWMVPRAALVLGIGRTLDDPVRGVPQTTYASVGLRITGDAHETLARRRGVKGASLSVRRVDESRRVFEIRGVEGARVEAMGDFTDWNPVALEKVGSVWRVERIVSPGLHRIALRIDGGEWIAPVNLPHAADDLGGVVGLITVP